MKLSSKEMIILAVFLSIVIMVAGTFLFILPEYEKIEPNKNTLQAAKNEKDQIYASLERENTIDQEIQDAIDQANTNSLYFYDDMTTHEADVIIRGILEATNMSTKYLTLDNFATTTLTVTDYIETVVTYPLKEYSGYVPEVIDMSGLTVQYDEEGNLVIPEDFQEKYEDALKEYMTLILSTQAQTVGAISAKFTVEGTRADFLNFLNYVANLEKATLIDSTTVAYTHTVTNTVGSPVIGEDGEELPVISGGGNSSTTEVQVNDNTIISADVTMTLFCVAPMQPQEDTAQAEAEPEPAA